MIEKICADWAQRALVWRIYQADYPQFIGLLFALKSLALWRTFSDFTIPRLTI